MELKYKKRLNKIIIFCMTVFVLSVVGTYFLANANRDAIMQVMEEVVSGMLNNLDVETPKSFGISLFFNNLRAAVIMTLIGFIPFLFLPVLTLIINGIIVGALPVVIQEKFFNTMIFGILPHGVFELSAIILGASFGVMICLNIFLRIFKKDYINFKELLKYILKKYLFVIIPLLIVAAIVESHITPIIIETMLF